jgi:hypothetical protein
LGESVEKVFHEEDVGDLAGVVATLYYTVVVEREEVDRWIGEVRGKNGKRV